MEMMDPKLAQLLSAYRQPLPEPQPVRDYTPAEQWVLDGMIHDETPEYHEWVLAHAEMILGPARRAGWC